MESTATSFGKYTLRTPLAATAGTAGYGWDRALLASLEPLGALSCKSITPKPLLGSPSPRICETEAGFINSIGLQNPGIEGFLEKHYLKFKAIGPHRIMSLAAFSLAEYVALVKKVAGLDGIDMIELNLSCPNTEDAKIFASDYGLIAELTKACSLYKQEKMLIIKLSPHISSVSHAACLAEENGADAIALVNTFKGMKIDVATGNSLIAKNIGGYSGKGIKPIVLSMVYETFKNVSIPILASGGVQTATDVLEYLLAGASLVGIGTSQMMDPQLPRKVLRDLKHYLRKNKVQVKDLIGSVNRLNLNS